MIVKLQRKARVFEAVLWTGFNRREVEKYVGFTPAVRFDNTNGEHLKIWDFFYDEWRSVPHNSYIIRTSGDQFLAEYEDDVHKNYDVIE